MSKAKCVIIITGNYAGPSDMIDHDNTEFEFKAEPVVRKFHPINFTKLIFFPFSRLNHRQLRLWLTSFVVLTI